MRRRFKKHIRLARYVVYKETLVDFKDHFWTFIGAFAGIAFIGLINKLQFAETDNIFLIGSFGASCVLIYGIPNSPLAQPRNLLGGHMISAVIGVTVHYIIPNELWLASALAVSLSIVAMQMTKTLHPPGGATALIANIGTEKIKSLGYLYVLSPVFTGAFILLIVAILINNRAAHRNYPKNRHWFKIWQRRYR